MSCSLFSFSALAWILAILGTAKNPFCAATTGASEDDGRRFAPLREEVPSWLTDFLPPSIVGGAKSSLVTTNPPPRVLGVSELKIEREFVPPDTAKSLYEQMLEAALPGPNDDFHPKLLGIYGDGGTKMKENNKLSASERVTRIQDMILRRNLHGSHKKESGILRVEYLKPVDMEKVDRLINDVIDNKVLEDEGTIHVYMSLPESAALANHTDTTDILVLQLEGSKEWLLCQQEEQEQEQVVPPFLMLNHADADATKAHIKKKLDKCTTYNDFEIDSLVCQKRTLYPGDVLFLPKRVVHSARATSGGLSAHLTFGFRDHMCPKQVEKQDDNSVMSTAVERFLSCNAAEGGTGCDATCDSSCSSSCDDSCDSNCNGGYCYSSCDGSCDASCDGSCNTLCDNGCQPPPSEESSSASSLKTILSVLGAVAVVAGIVVAVVVLVRNGSCSPKGDLHEEAAVVVESPTNRKDLGLVVVAAAKPVDGGRAPLNEDEDSTKEEKSTSSSPTAVESPAVLGNDLELVAAPPAEEEESSWKRNTCTFVNQNSMHLACEMRGRGRQERENSKTSAANVQTPPPVVDGRAPRSAQGKDTTSCGPARGADKKAGSVEVEWHV